MLVPFYTQLRKAKLVPYLEKPFKEDRQLAIKSLFLSGTSAKAIWFALSKFSDVILSVVTVSGYITIMQSLDLLAIANGELPLPSKTTDGRDLVTAENTDGMVFSRWPGCDQPSTKSHDQTLDQKSDDGLLSFSQDFGDECLDFDNEIFNEQDQTRTNTLSQAQLESSPIHNQRYLFITLN